MSRDGGRFALLLTPLSKSPATRQWGIGFAAVLRPLEPPREGPTPPSALLRCAAGPRPMPSPRTSTAGRAGTGSMSCMRGGTCGPSWRGAPAALGTPATGTTASSGGRGHCLHREPNAPRSRPRTWTAKSRPTGPGGEPQAARRRATVPGARCALLRDERLQHAECAAPLQGPAGAPSATTATRRGTERPPPDRPVTAGPATNRGPRAIQSRLSAASTRSARHSRPHSARTRAGFHCFRRLARRRPPTTPPA